MAKIHMFGLIVTLTPDGRNVIEEHIMAQGVIDGEECEFFLPPMHFGNTLCVGAILGMNLERVPS